MTLLRSVFGERIISNRVWPQQTLYLAQPDYYLWGAKEAVYRDNPHTFLELKEAIADFITKMLQM
jgi:hypothetical protein